MSEKSEVFYSVRLDQSSEPLKFETAAALQEWAEAESAAWEPILTSEHKRLWGNNPNSYDRARTLIRKLLKSASALAQDDGGPQRQDLNNRFEEAFAKGQLPYPLSTVRNYLLALKNTIGERAMQIALASLVSPPEGNSWILDLGDVESRMAFTSAMLFKLGIDPSAPQIAKQNIDQLFDRFEGIIRQAVSHADSFESVGEARLSDFDSDVLNMKELAKGEFVTTLAEFENNFHDSVASFKSTETAYREHMRLRAPVEYWSKKAIDHSNSAKGYGIAVTTYAVLASTALLVGLWELARLTIPTTATDPAQYFRTAGIGLIASTIVIWVGRVLLRLFLSERHLATDAEERVTLVMTYLALTQEGKIEPTDRPIVLAPLFRAASDGIVKDDGAPESSLGALLARGVSSPR